MASESVTSIACGIAPPESEDKSVTGKPTEDWDLPDVAGKSQDEVEEIAVQVVERLSKLLKGLQVSAGP